MMLLFVVFFFFKQKTAYEMRISDWSSDVCSSDLLVIGIVVDDAIVVVENVERNIEEGLTPLAAAHQAMREVSGPIIAIALVLCAVFVPMAFLSGVTGQFYKQFAVTIAISTVDRKSTRLNSSH